MVENDFPGPQDYKVVKKVPVEKLSGAYFEKARRKAMYDNTIGGMGPGAYFKEP